MTWQPIGSETIELKVGPLRYTISGFAPATLRGPGFGGLDCANQEAAKAEARKHLELVKGEIEGVLNG